MYRNKATGQILSDEDVDAIVISWADAGFTGRPRESVIADLLARGFEYSPDAALPLDSAEDDYV